MELPAPVDGELTELEEVQSDEKSEDSSCKPRGYFWLELFLCFSLPTSATREEKEKANSSLARVTLLLLNMICTSRESRLISIKIG